MKWAYYNEIDPFAAAWLRELIKAGLIADGEVDDRSIELVRPDDVRGFAQCHFFAGIGGWSLALRLAGWDDSRAVWTGSCPCQPFSSAGAQAGGHDPRDLWPVWFQLVKECRPYVVFGEQVEAAIGHGWLDRLCDDLEAESYAVGPCGLPGPCVGAFDIRQRLWFVAESENERYERSREARRRWDGSTDDGTDGIMADTDGERRTRKRLLLRPEETGRHASEVPQVTGSGAVGELDDADAGRRRSYWKHRISAASRGGRSLDDDDRAKATDAGALSNVGDSASGGLGIDGRSPRHSGHADESIASFWSDCDWLPCADGKARPVEPGTFPLADGVSARVGRLRGYGNAIKPQVAQVFIESYMTVSSPETR